MADLKDLENHIHTIAEAEKKGGILDIQTEAIHILSLCNNIRISMINEVIEDIDCNIDVEQADDITMLLDFQMFAKRISKGFFTIPDNIIHEYLKYK